MTRSLLLALALAGCGALGVRGDGDSAGSSNAPGATGTSADGTVTSDATALCGADLEVFTTRVWQPVLAPTCLTCHGPGGVGSMGSNLDLDPDDLDASMRATFRVADNLLLKPTDQHPDGHGGGAVVAEGTAAWEALSFWVGWIAGESCDPPELPSCDALEAHRQLRRLTHAEYDRTLEDLLGLSWTAGESFAADTVVDGFRNDADALVVSGLLADQYRASAEEAAFAVPLGQVLPCSAAVDGEEVCAARFVEDFGLRAFRRPLTQADVDRYTALWAEVAVDEGFDTGIRWVIAALLQSPHFLYRAELGVQGDPGVFTLTGWEVATALSYDIWGTTPDDALLARAASGELDDPAQVQAVATEMLSDPRSLETAADLVEVWLDLDQLRTVSREGLTPELREALRSETRDLVRDVATDGTVGDLFTARHTFVDALLAEHYGLEGTGEVALDGVRYGGLLTQGSVLATHGRPLGSGPVQRGVLVRERLLCEDLPPPPANLDTSPPPVDPSASTRDQYWEHSADPACSGCHQKIDPLGFGFEHYDELGRYRDTDRGHTVDDSGDVDGTPFVGPFELATTLLAEPRFRACFVQTWRRHATGVEACADDPGTDVGLLAPLAELTGQTGFTRRVGGPDEGDTPAHGSRIDPDPPDDVTTDPGTGEGVVLTLTTVSDWGSGYCADGLVENFGADPVVWSVSASPDGSIDNLWNAVVDDSTGDWWFSGADWNAELAPGASTTFGFCAAR